MVSDALQGGWLAHTVRWRGWQAPPKRQEDDDATTTSAEVSATALAARDAVSPPDAGAHDPAARPDAGAGRQALLATATRLPPLDWAPLQALALADQARRQALVQAGEEEEMLVLLMLVEVL